MAYNDSYGLISIATAYSGGNYTYTKIPLKYVQPNTYLSTPNQIQDLDSYRNANGVLKRTVVSHTASKIEFNTPYISETDKIALVNLIKSGYNLGDGNTPSSQRRIKLRYYGDWSSGYEFGYFYVPDIDFNYGGMVNGKLMYQPIRIAFIEY